MATLTAQYVDVVTRALPEDRRAGVAEGLKKSVARTIESLHSRSPELDAEAAEYAAVAALGDPALRMPRAAEGRDFVVSPTRFVGLLGLLLLLIVTGVGIARIVTALTTGQSWDQGLSEVLFSMLKSGYRALCIFTLGWFLLEVIAQRRQAKRSGNPDWTPDDLSGDRA